MEQHTTDSIDMDAVRRWLDELSTTVYGGESPLISPSILDRIQPTFPGYMTRTPYLYSSEPPFHYSSAMRSSIFSKMKEQPMSTSTIDPISQAEPIDEVPEIIPLSLANGLEQYFENNDSMSQQLQAAIGIPFPIENLTFREFQEKTDCLKVANMETTPIAEDQEIILIKDDRLQPTFRAFVSSPQHKLPYVSGDNVHLSMMNDENKPFANGFLMHVADAKYEMICFMPFGNGKKLYATGIKYNDAEYANITQMFSVGMCGVDEPLPNVVVPGYPARDPLSALTDTDRIWCSKASARFQKIFDDWGTVRQALISLNELLYSTVDPNYMKKILYLNNQLSYPPFERNR
jgi:hypothetical protein